MKGKEAHMKSINIEAAPDNLSQVQDFIEGELSKAGCPPKVMMQIAVAVEEIYINIARYAYCPATGEAVICCDTNHDPTQVTIQFLDHGKPFDPLSRSDADITVPAMEREIGGLGILMTKKLMDGVEYQYKDGKNILTLKKEWDKSSK